MSTFIVSHLFYFYTFVPLIFKHWPSIKYIYRRKAAIDVEMEEIKPLIEEAKQAVGNIKSNTLSEIRSLRAPPGKIID